MGVQFQRGGKCTAYLVTNTKCLSARYRVGNACRVVTDRRRCGAEPVVHARLVAERTLSACVSGGRALCSDQNHMICRVENVVARKLPRIVRYRPSLDNAIDISDHIQGFI